MENTYINLTAVVLLLIANGFFVAAEFALVSARGFRLEMMAANGSAAARHTVEIQNNLESYLASCQLGITMASLGLGWVGEPAVAAILKPLLIPVGMSEAALHTTSFIIGFIVFSSLHIVVGEQVPKTFAIRKPEPMLLAVVYPMKAFYWLSFPLTWVLNRTSRAILRYFKVEEATHAEVLTDQEIGNAVDVSMKHGEMEQEKAEMIHNLLRFDERAVERIMIPRVECNVLRLDSPPEENVRIMRGTKHSRFPLVDGGMENLVGIILMKDLVDTILGGEDEPWTDIKKYCREPMVVPETLKVSSLFETMRTKRAHMACVCLTSAPMEQLSRFA